MHRRDLPDPIRPVPMRQNVGHREVGTPVSLIEVKTIFLESRQINDAEVAAARGSLDPAKFFDLLFCLRPKYGIVTEVIQDFAISIVGSRFTKIVEAGPDEFPGHMGVLLQRSEFFVRHPCPPWAVEVE